MSCQKLLQEMIGVMLVVLFLVGCGAPTPEPPTPTATPTPIPPTPTATPTPIPPTPTPTLQPMSIRGTILDTEGNPVVNKQVILYYYDIAFSWVDSTDDFTNNTDTNEQGVFVLRNVPPSSIVPGNRYTLHSSGNCMAGCSLVVHENVLYFAECYLGDKSPAPDEYFGWFTLEDGQAVDLGEIIYLEEGDPLCP